MRKGLGLVSEQVLHHEGDEIAPVKGVTPQWGLLPPLGVEHLVLRTLLEEEPHKGQLKTHHYGRPGEKIEGREAVLLVLLKV